MYRGVATFTLDYGKCPKWLFDRMVRLGREMTRVLIEEYGPDEYIKRIADPVWFQSLGTVLAFDWNASGLTTILTAALKEGIRGQEQELGIFIAGGKGKTSRKTPEQIAELGERARMPEGKVRDLEYNSRMAAKVDSALVQDGYKIYHHSFFFSRNGAWSVVQQGMNVQSQTARRYHWFSENAKDLIEEPHTAISSQALHAGVLNLTAKKSAGNRNISTGLVQGGYQTLMKDIQLLRKHSSELSRMITLQQGKDRLTLARLENKEFSRHPVEAEDFSKSKYLEKILQKIAAEKPQSYEKLLSMQGVGPKTMRALSLVAEIIYGADPSYEDPARYSFAHGGKDETPFPVDTMTYDATIAILEGALRRTRLPLQEKNNALRRLIHETYTSR